MFIRNPSVGSAAAEHSAARRPLGQGRAEGRGAASRAFTLFELLVVVSIIVILVSILIPTLGAVKTKAQRAKTQALISNISSDIDAYYQSFHAYPGPYAAAITTAAPASKISGAQNMLIGLSYPLANPATPTVAPVINAWPYGPPYNASGPIDYANQKPDGNYSQLAPFFSPSNKQVLKAVGATPNALSDFPVLYDAFTDGLPILYFRRSVGIETPVSQNPTSSLAAYYVDENVEYTKATSLQATSGTIYNEASGSFGIPELTNAVSNSGGTARGSYVLISAGADHYYGTYKAKVDDVIQVGGD